MTQEEWIKLLRELQNEPDGDLRTVSATDFRRSIGSASGPVHMTCDDGKDYVVKGRDALSKGLVTEHVIARLGIAIGAPIPAIVFVNIPEALRSANSELQAFYKISHGMGLVADVTDRESLQHHDIPENRERFARLRLLYSWASASDQQFIYAKASPQLVYSVDHGHFLPGGPKDWTVDTLKANEHNVALDSTFEVCGLTPLEMQPAIDAVGCVTDWQIARFVATPPDEWGVTMDDRAGLCNYFSVRRDQLAASGTG